MDISKIYLFICFHFIYSWLKITHLHTKKSLYSLYSNNIELIDINSVTEQEMQSVPNQFLKSMWTSWQTHTHICTYIHQSTTPANSSIPMQWVFWWSLYKSYMLQIYFTKTTRTFQRHPFFNFSLNDCDNLILLGTRSHIFDPRNETDYYYFFIYSWLVKITHAHKDIHTHTHTHK